MKLRIYMRTSGFERIAEAPPGTDPRFYSWDFAAVPESEPIGGDLKQFLGEVEFTLAPREVAVVETVAAIEKQIQTTYANAEMEVRALEEKKQNFLAISMEAP